MGKVGSRTIFNSLQRLQLDMPIYHTHGLTQNYIDEKEIRSKRYFGTDESDFIHLTVPWKSQYLRNLIKRGFDGKKCKVVTVVRDPIAVNISSFFERIDKVDFTESWRTYTIKSTKDEYEYKGRIDDMESLKSLFFEKCAHNESLTFLDNELKSVFGVDVFESEFPKSEGYRIYEGEQVDVLLIRLESLNDCAKKAFNEFLNIEDFTLVNINIGSEKDYAYLYQKFKELVVLPDTYIDKMYRSKYAQHFYSKEEIDRFITKWRRLNKPLVT
ncbi:MAG: hypothetical protein SCALA701_09810 [Candidatus Scalindua sp.]|nr:MAG: hypothetical protein SCALA701_09810 [Candidatus Scalindua sp.]